MELTTTIEIDDLQKMKENMKNKTLKENFDTIEMLTQSQRNILLRLFVAEISL